MEVHRIHFDFLDSTNSWAKAHVSEFDFQHLTCILADTQTNGYGGFKRAWISRKGNLHFSLFFCLPLNDPRLPNLAQITAFAICNVLLEKGIPMQIKWPNDLLYANKKLGGILVETTPIEKHLGVIVGIGINVNAPIEGFISLSEISYSTWDLEALLNDILLHFQTELDKGFCPKDFEAYLAFKGALVSFYVGEESFEGTILGLNEHGQLKLKLSDGKIAQFSSGSIHTLRTL